MRLHLNIAAIAWIALLAAQADETVALPAGIYRPLFRGENDAKEIPVRAFVLDTHPVTNAQYLEFVRVNPRWQRSQVKRLFADVGYLQHWAGDLEPGSGSIA